MVCFHTMLVSWEELCEANRFTSLQKPSHSNSATRMTNLRLILWNWIIFHGTRDIISHDTGVDLKQRLGQKKAVKEFYHSTCQRLSPETGSCNSSNTTGAFFTEFIHLPQPGDSDSAQPTDWPFIRWSLRHWGSYEGGGKHLDWWAAGGSKNLNVGGLMDGVLCDPTPLKLRIYNMRYVKQTCYTFYLHIAKSVATKCVFEAPQCWALYWNDS